MNTTRRGFFVCIAGLFAAPVAVNEVPACAVTPPIGAGLFGLPYRNERMFDGDWIGMPRPISIKDWRLPFTVSPELNAALDDLEARTDPWRDPAETPP